MHINRYQTSNVNIDHLIENMIVYFVSDDSIAYIGFTATYQMLNFTEQCGGTTDSPYGEVFSPRFSQGLNYPISRDCTWVINTVAQQQIAAQFNAFSLGSENH